MKFLFVFLLCPLISKASQVDRFDWPQLQKVVNEQSLCSSSKTAELCRRLPWSPRPYEGVTEVNGIAVVIIDADIREGSELARWEKQFPINQREEMTAYFTIANESFAAGLERSFHPSVILVRVAEKGDARIIKTVSFFDSYALRAEVQQQFKIVQGEIMETRGEWIPPLSFKMSHEYRFIQ